ncbi:hypothetical protein [Micromonospora sp. NPDC049102]|uniref:hypothetical protein n=1 Tax=Micromonospora sp. NPDC049102 TaxID=3364265 RepID=UPI00371BE632
MPGDGGLGLALRAAQADYRAGDQVRLDLTVTNSTGAACALPTTAVGTVQIAGVRRVGRDLTPTLARSFHEERVARPPPRRSPPWPWRAPAWRATARPCPHIGTRL